MPASAQACGHLGVVDRHGEAIQAIVSDGEAGLSIHLEAVQLSIIADYGHSILLG
jgi:hypothetical protein